MAAFEYQTVDEHCRRAIHRGVHPVVDVVLGIDPLDTRIQSFIEPARVEAHIHRTLL